MDLAGWTHPSSLPLWLEGLAEGRAQRGSPRWPTLEYFWVGEMRRFLLLLGPRKAPPPGRGWAPGSGAEAIASRGRARPAKIGPRALWTRGEHSPPRGSELLRGTELDDPQPNRSEMPPSSLRFQSLTKKAPAPGHSLFRRVQAPKAGGRARASPETLQLELQLDRSTPLVPGDFGVRRGNQNTSPQSARAGLFAIGSPAHSTGPRLASVLLSIKGTKKNPTRRFPKSHKDSSSTSVCAGPGSALAAAPRGGPAIRRQRNAPAGGSTTGPGLHTWSLSQRICPGNGNSWKKHQIKAEAGGGQTTGESGQSRCPPSPYLPKHEPTLLPNAGGSLGGAAGPRLWGFGAGRPPRPSPSHSTPRPLTLPAGPVPHVRRVTHCPKPRLLAAPSLPGPHTGHRLEKGGGESSAKRGVTDSMDKSRRCASLRVPTRLPSGSAKYA